MNLFFRLFVIFFFLFINSPQSFADLPVPLPAASDDFYSNVQEIVLLVNRSYNFELIPQEHIFVKSPYIGIDRIYSLSENALREYMIKHSLDQIKLRILSDASGARSSFDGGTIIININVRYDLENIGGDDYVLGAFTVVMERRLSGNITVYPKVTTRVRSYIFWEDLATSSQSVEKFDRALLDAIGDSLVHLDRGIKGQ